MSLAGTSGLRLDQAPPLSIPGSFFLVVPIAMIAGGSLLLLHGASALASGWGGATIALTHLGTLGVLTAGMMGALYQMAPVLAGAPVPRVGLARLALASLITGITGFVWGLDRGLPLATGIGGSALTIALVTFLGPVVVALTRAPARTDTVRGMRIALLALAGAGTVGVRLALGHAGMGLLAPRDLWLQIHLTMGLVGWVGGLITSVSWQVVPMFYLTPPVSPRLARATPFLLLAGWLGPCVVLLASSAGAVPEAHAAGWAAVTALPGVITLWLLHPWSILRALHARRRRLVDGSARFWFAAMAAAPLILLTALPVVLGAGPRWALLFGWLVIWGWGATVLHGMLTRIVPFLVWFHRISPWIGKRPTPGMRQIWPEGRVRLGLGLHVSATLLGLAAIVSREDSLARGTGALVVATGAWLLICLIRSLATPVPENVLFPAPPGASPPA